MEASTSYLPPRLSPVASAAIHASPALSRSNSRKRPEKSSPRSSQPIRGSSTTKRSVVGGGGSSAGCRLLWRGKLVVDSDKGKGRALYGIAIVAHLFSVPLLSPHQLASSSQPSPFDDPFSPATSLSQGADMCLGLEMLRGGDIKVLSSIPISSLAHAVTHDGDRMDTPRECDGKEKYPVETPTDVRVYVDERCEDTVTWFERTFCTRAKEGTGVRIEVGGEEYILFASFPTTLLKNHANSSLSPQSTGGQESTVARPPLKLLLGRVSQIKIRKPRPDDPMPRESLFASKLRRTTSMPVLNFGLSKTKSSSLLSKTSSADSLFDSAQESKAAKEKALAAAKKKNELRKEMKGKGKERINASVSSRSTLGTSTTTSKSKSAMQKSKSAAELKSTKDDPFASSSSQNPPARRASIPAPGTGTPGRRGSKRPLKRSASEMVMGIKVKVDANSIDSAYDGFVPGSPTPSIANTVQGDEDEEMDDLATALPSFRFGSRSSSIAPAGSAGAGGVVAGGGGGRKSMKRSNSAPVGLFAKVEGRVGANGEDSKLETLNAIGSHQPGEDGSQEIEIKNKATIRKLVLLSLTTAGVGRTDDIFKEVFTITLKGVQFALRATMKSSPINRNLASQLIETHVGMYVLPTTLPPSPPASSEPAAIVLVKDDTLFDFDPISPAGFSSAETASSTLLVV